MKHVLAHCVFAHCIFGHCIFAHWIIKHVPGHCVLVDWICSLDYEECSCSLDCLCECRSWISLFTGIPCSLDLGLAALFIALEMLALEL